MITSPRIPRSKPRTSKSGRLPLSTSYKLVLDRIAVFKKGKYHHFYLVFVKNET